jgi:hypothetical protein
MADFSLKGRGTKVLVFTAVLVLAAIGVGALYLHQRSSNKTMLFTDQIYNAKELKIREWGVSMPMADFTRDPYYAFDKQTGKVRVSTHRLDELSAKAKRCSPGHVGITLGRAKPGDKIAEYSGATWSEPMLMQKGTKVGQYYYFETTSGIELLCAPQYERADATEMQNIEQVLRQEATQIHAY